MMLSKENLHSYQKRAVDFIRSKKRVALFLDMGLGKTISTLTAIEELMYDSFDVKKTLIIAPLRVCNTVWEQEGKKWKHTKHLSFVNLSGGKKNMLVGLQKQGDIYLINRENIPALVEHLGKKWPFDMVVIDESSSFKSHRAKRFKALKKVTRMIKYIVLLTGTPSPNGYMDLWSQFYLIDSGERLYNTITKYRNRWFNKDFMGFKYEPVPGAINQIQNRIKDITISMSAEDYLQLPEAIYTVLNSRLEGELLDMYKQLKSDMLINIDGLNITAMSAAAASNKLLQFCSGSLYDDSGNVVKVHNIKIEMLKEVIELNEGEPILVAYNYKHSLASLLEHFPSAKVLDKAGDIVDEWNKGNVPLLLAHPASAGHGLNLQKGGRLIVWYDYIWSLELYKQFNARLHRQGQERPVTIIHLAVGEIECRLMDTMVAKDATQEGLLNALKQEAKIK